MRVALVAVLGALLGGPALAQTISPMTGTTAAPPTTPPAAAAPAATRAPRQTMQQRFEAANTTHDGHLTREQARGKLPQVYRHFADIDTGRNGYVTLDEVRAYSRAQRQAHRAAPAQQ